MTKYFQYNPILIVAKLSLYSDMPYGRIGAVYDLATINFRYVVYSQVGFKIT